MVKEILVGCGIGAVLLMVGGGVVIAQQSAGAGSPLQARSAIEQTRDNLVVAQQKQGSAVQAFCRYERDADACRVSQYASNRALITLYNQVVLRSDESEARIANACTEQESRSGSTDWRGIMDCIVAQRQNGGLGPLGAS